MDVRAEAIVHGHGRILNLKANRSPVSHMLLETPPSAAKEHAQNGPRSSRHRGPGQARTWLVLVIGFGALVFLIAFSGFSALRKARQSYLSVSAIFEAGLETEQTLGQLRTDLQLSAIAVRDFLLDSTADPTASRAELTQLRDSATAALGRLRPSMLEQDSARFDRMSQQVEEYWKSLDAFFVQTPGPRSETRLSFLKERILPRRQAALELATQIEELTTNSVRKRREEIDRQQSDLAFYVARILGLTILLGLLIATASVLRILRLESIADRQHRDVLQAEAELRDLSSQLVRVQEEERRSLSRELHDQIGQLLTALRIGLGNLEKLLGRCPEDTRHQLDQAKRISEQALRSVRDLAMGLRPAMLDDLGLGAALEWQARQHSRLCGVPVAVNLSGALERLSDAQNTCVYRIVQEALNNIAKHAQASEIDVSVASGAGAVTILIRDNGTGFEPGSGAARGLGIVGIKERVRQLDGNLNIDSAPGSGTSLRVTIPLTGEGLP